MEGFMSSTAIKVLRVAISILLLSGILITAAFVLTRFRGSKAETVGLLKREQSNYQNTQASTPENTRVPLDDIWPFLGSWLNLRKEDGIYRFERSCPADIPSITINTEGKMEVNYGEEKEHMEVINVKPGSTAGSYVLNIKREDGSREEFEWTVYDEKKEIVRVKGVSDFFKSGTLFINEEKVLSPGAPFEDGADNEKIAVDDPCPEDE